jgi:hypothetical protein
MTGELSKKFHGVGIGPLSTILAVKRHSENLILMDYVITVSHGRQGLSC